jgi:hypothetical protein
MSANSSSITANQTAQTSTASIFDPFFLISFVYTTPIISVIGFVLNVLCAVVLLKAKLASSTNKYLLFRTLIHMALLLFTSLNALFYCENCPVSDTLVAQVLFFAVNIYLSRVVFLVTALVEIAISYQRLLLFKKAKKFFFKWKFWYTFLVCMLVGFLLNIPYLFAFDIVQVRSNSDDYMTTRNRFGRLLAYRIYIITLNTVQSFLSFIVLLILNALVTVEFKKYIRRKKSLFDTVNQPVESNTKQLKPTVRQSIPELSREKTDPSNLTKLSVALIEPHHSKKSLQSNKLRKNSAPIKTNASGSVEHSFTAMIIVSSAFFTFTRLVQCINVTLLQIFPLFSFASAVITYSSHISFISQLLTSVYCGSNLFIYLAFNKRFRSTFVDMFGL